MGQFMIFHRCENWEKELESFIDESKPRQFAWGTCDCVCWAAEWFARLTGYDPMSEIRGQYNSEEQAYELLAQKAGLSAEISALLPVRQAGFHKRGDVAMCMINGKETLGIVGARGFVFFKTMSIGVIAKRIDIFQAWGCD